MRDVSARRRSSALMKPLVTSESPGGTPRRSVTDTVPVGPAPYREIKRPPNVGPALAGDGGAMRLRTTVGVRSLRSMRDRIRLSGFWRDAVTEAGRVGIRAGNDVGVGTTDLVAAGLAKAGPRCVKSGIGGGDDNATSGSQLAVTKRLTIPHTRGGAGRAVSASTRCANADRPRVSASMGP